MPLDIPLSAYTLKCEPACHRYIQLKTVTEENIVILRYLHQLSRKAVQQRHLKENKQYTENVNAVISCQKLKLKLKLKLNKALDANSSLSYGAAPAIWDHTVLPATRHK